MTTGTPFKLVHILSLEYGLLHQMLPYVEKHVGIFNEQAQVSGSGNEWPLSSGKKKKMPDTIFS